MKNRICFVAFVLLFLACSPATDITGTWRNPGYEGEHIRRIIVTAITGNAEAKETIENDLETALTEKGYEVVKGQEVFGPADTLETKLQRTAFLDKLSDAGIDAILAVSVLNDDSDNRFVPGKYNYEPIQRFEYYRGFFGYYNERQPTVNTPGFFEENNVFFLETNLYDTRTEELIWSAQSETYSPADMTAVSRDFSSVVITRLEKDGLIRED